MLKRRILIVDDDRHISEGAGLRLRGAGFDTLFAFDGVAGVAAAREQRPDAIVMDIRMPEMDGLAALKVLKSSPETSEIPVVMLSASVVDEEAALDAGAHYFIRKPFKGSFLIEAVDAATKGGAGGNSSCLRSTRDGVRVEPSPRSVADEIGDCH